jgi:gamma-glutamyltranspeptidase/glutathione hydrolase
MTPTILTQDGHVALVLGTPGGSRIFTSIFQVLTNWHDFDMPLHSAVASARIHHQLLPVNTLFEEPYKQLDATTKAELNLRGYVFENQGWDGDMQSILVTAARTIAVSDPRGRGVGVVLQ